MTTNSVERWINTAASNAHALGARNGIRRKNARALEKGLYILAVGLAGVWTLVMWGVYALLGLSDEALSAGGRLFAIDAQVLEWLTSFVGGAEQLGGALVLIVWTLGVALLMLAVWLGRRLIRTFSRVSSSGDLHAM